MWWLAVAGAAANQLSTWLQSEDDKARLRKQQENDRQAYEYQRRYRDDSFNLQKAEALETLGIQQNRLAQALGADTAGFNLSMAGQARQEQAARIGLADSAGAAISAQGASGTRGSDSLQMRIDYGQKELAAQIDLQRRGSELSRQNMTRQYSNQFNDIGREISSWGADGYRTRAKSLEDTYLSQMNNLKMQGYDEAISDAGYTIWDFFYSGLTGAAQGMGMGSQLQGLNNQRQQGDTQPPKLPETTK